MGKISLVSSKYIIHASINIDGIVDRPDVIGAIFGQTEGLLGSELELRELQRNGKIGRIEVNIDTKEGKSKGEIIIPSSLDKTETALIAAALETIERIGPCTARVTSENIEDVRILKRTQVVEKAKELLKNLTECTLPDSQEITEEVASSVRMMEMTEYGKDRLAAGPAVQDSEEIIIVEGRADVLNLLKNGFKNAIAVNGTSIPDTVKELTKRKIVTVFVDGDRGGDLIIKELLATCEIDFITKAPDGKEVEEITKKELNKALRSKLTLEQYQLESGNNRNSSLDKRDKFKPKERPIPIRTIRPINNRERVSPITNLKLTKKEKDSYQEMLEDLVGTRGAYLLDKDLNILGKVPTSELPITIKNMGSEINTIVFDGAIERDLVKLAERSDIKNIVGMSLNFPGYQTNIQLISKTNL
ncbi:MAG: DNA primase DnaG [Candidatus Woesearchaeota archaeon]